jgi:catechol 2,3-dioxygenase-like lactoylglutathione lyase family enzyme
MGLLKLDDVTHWSIPVNHLEESEAFYRDVLGLQYEGRLGNSGMCCFTIAGHSILLCQRNEPIVRTAEQDNYVHHSFTVRPDVFEQACRLFRERGVRIARPIVYREHGFFPGREIYFLDPSGNVLELRDPTWKAGMPTPTYEEIAPHVASVIRE